MRACCIALETISSHLWWSIMWEKECMCMWDGVTLLYSTKLTKHCKPPITEKIENIKKKKILRRKISIQQLNPLPKRIRKKQSLKSAEGRKS